MGWRNDTRGGQPLEIKFEFDQVREFKAVHIFCNNQFTREVQVNFILLYDLHCCILMFSNTVVIYDR